MPDRAASLTYYATMSLFPAVLVGVALLGLLGQESTVGDVVSYLGRKGLSRELQGAVRDMLSNAVATAHARVGVALAVGIVAGLYGASGAFSAAGRAINGIYEIRDARSFLPHKLFDVAMTLVAIVLGVAAMTMVFLGGGVARDLFGTIGLGSSAASVFSYARWPAALVLMLFMYAFLYAFAPAITPRRIRWITRGAAVGVTLWIVASIGFYEYVANLSSYSATYGAFAGLAVLLLWLWISNLAFLFGAEVNAQFQWAESAAEPPDPPETVRSVAREATPA